MAESHWQYGYTSDRIDLSNAAAIPADDPLVQEYRKLFTEDEYLVQPRRIPDEQCPE